MGLEWFFFPVQADDNYKTGKKAFTPSCLSYSVPLKCFLPPPPPHHPKSNFIYILRSCLKVKMYFQHQLLAAQKTAVTSPQHTHTFTNTLPTEITTPIKLCFPDIYPINAAKQSGLFCFFLASKPIILLSLSLEINICPEVAGLFFFFWFSPLLQPGIQIVRVPRNNGDGKTKQTQGMFFIIIITPEKWNCLWSAPHHFPLFLFVCHRSLFWTPSGMHLITLSTWNWGFKGISSMCVL